VAGSSSDDSGGADQPAGPAGVSRRHFVVGGGLAATAATAGFSLFDLGGVGVVGEPVAVAGAQDLPARPNFLIISADEYRFPVAYESQALKEFRATHLVGEESLRDDGLEFTNHYVMSAACAPSRTSLLTGQYPSLHGVSQTSGAAKSAFEDDCYWLDPDTVPTMGDYFRAGGYDTHIRGKWHVSEADILIPGTKDAMLTFDEHGNPDPAKEASYLAADRLDGFGFSGWIGPEAHGANPLNSASSATDAIGRDPKFADQIVDLLDDLASGGGSAPWLVFGGFLNPHDITTWGAGTLNDPSWNLQGQLDGSAVPEEPFDQAYAATATEDLASKPSCQQSYVDTYPQMFQPTANTQDYRRFYYQLQQNVNVHIQRVLDTLASHPEMAANTIVVFTSDHGTLLGAHGGMFQKWHQAYEEATHVPFIIHSPTLFSGRQTIDAPTSHADLLPTLLGLAGLDAAELQQQLAATHNEVHPLVGRDLSPIVRGEVSPDTLTEPVYFTTDDEVSRGSQQISFTGQMYESVIQPNHVETVIALLATGPGGAVEKWKYSRYTDQPQFWSDPQGSSSGTAATDVVTMVNGVLTNPGPKTAETTVKDTPVPEELEAYNLARDPLELHNLAGSSDPAVVAALAELAAMLVAQCASKRLTPSSGTVPSQSTDCGTAPPPPTTTTTSTTTSSTSTTTSSSTSSSTTPSSSSSTSSTTGVAPAGGPAGTVIPRYAG
jgi:choline-sulfatase